MLIVGAGEAGRTVLKELNSSNKISYTPVGFVDDNTTLRGTYVCGIPVLGETKEIKSIAESKKAKLIIVAIPSAKPSDIKRITEYCLSTGCEIKVVPGLYQLINGKVSVSQLRNVAIEDLLGRDPISVNLDEVMGYIENRVVLVTGGGGSIGSELCRQIAKNNPKLLIVFDIYENNAHAIGLELKDKYPELKNHLSGEAVSVSKFVYDRRLQGQPFVTVKFGQDQCVSTAPDLVSRATRAVAADAKYLAKSAHLADAVKNADRSILFAFLAALKRNARHKHLAASSSRREHLNEQASRVYIKSAIKVRPFKNRLESPPQSTRTVAFYIVFLHILRAQHDLELGVADKYKFHFNLTKIRYTIIIIYLR